MLPRSLTTSRRLGPATDTLGVPPQSKITGTGTEAPFGSLGAVRYAPIALIGKYQFDTGGAWHPYVGAGGVYYAVVKAIDGFVSALEVDNKFGAALQAGVQYDITSGLGVFLDFKKFYVKTQANGTVPAMGGAPAPADVTLDPAVVQVGVVLHF